jgi:uncharacterized membrane-anchored protein
VLDALDIDRATAEAIVRRKPSVVLNVQPSISGRYPAGGASVIASAGIVLVDTVGSELLAVPDGTIATVTIGRGPAAALRQGGPEGAPPQARASVVAGSVETSGTVMDAASIDTAMEGARAGLPTQLAAFTANAMDALARVGDTVLEGENLPSIGVDLKGRHVVVVAPGFGLSAQLRGLKHYLKDHRPVVIAVGDATLALAESKLHADVVIVTADGLGVPALTGTTHKGVKHVVAHSPEGTELATARVDALTVPHSRSDLAIASEDLALLLAHHGGAEVIVAVGVESTLLDYVESGRPQTAGTFLTRLAAGSRLVDARTVGALYRSRVSPVVVAVAVALALGALSLALWLNDQSRAWIESLVGAAGGGAGGGL